jgi:O-antigen ligase
MLKLLLLCSIAFIIQMVLVVATSIAPFEQEFFGRTGRALGFATYFSLIIVMLATALYATLEKSKTICAGVLLACLVSSSYSVIQNFGYDVFNWVTMTNGIIGTLGNPNFQSSLVAMALMPSLVILVGSRKNQVITTFIVSFLLLTLYICESTQGYIASAVSLGVFLSMYLWFRNKKTFFIYNLLLFSAGLIAILGMLNKGPLSSYLYKVSVQSRGEMWRTAYNTIRDNPAFGVGLDSFGDVSLQYRDQKTANGINEFTDNAHNFFLQFAATGGIILSLLYIGIVILSFYSFLVINKKLNHFDPKLTALFSSWVSFQLQSFISPANISMLLWNFIFCGYLIGLAANLSTESSLIATNITGKQEFTRPFSYLFLIFALIIMYPWFNSDKVAWKANQTGDGLLAIKAAKMHPESSVRYSRIALALYSSNLFDQSLDVARSAVKFNSRSIQAWFLILANEKAPVDERKNARKQILILDPFNKDVYDFKL